MDKIESSIKTIPHSQQSVYNLLSDLSNVERIKDRLPEDKLQELTFDRDSISISVNPVGKVAIFNSLIPVIGAVSSCLCLSEPFYWKYIIAGALATSGIYIINKGK